MPAVKFVHALISNKNPRFWMDNSTRAALENFIKRCQRSSVKKIPAAMTVPMTPATLGPMAYINR